MSLLLFEDILSAKPFLKWAGGKGQLIPAIEKSLPIDFSKRKNVIYIEPFIGSGAILFWMLKRFNNIAHAIINDINVDLYIAYQCIKTEPESLIAALYQIQAAYYMLANEESRKNFFLEKRQAFNSRLNDNIEHTALLIFLNRTCFNGLYRVNSKNHFNVPFGKYDRPKICDPETIRADSIALQRVIVLNGDYSYTTDYFAGNNVFYYLDPPYKPISKTASFNAYSHEAFGDAEQVKLKQFCDSLTGKGCTWLLSNSDPKNVDPNDNFFEDLYRGDNIYIDRVKAKRNINSNSAKRGEIAELLISNYEKNII